MPCNAPVVTLNVAHVGRFAIANVNALPSGSLAVGLNVYAAPCVAVVGGAPEIVGGRLPVGACTVIANAGSDAVAAPSLTAITMLPNVPVVPTGGVPLNRPVVVLNAAQLGRPEIANVSGLPSASLAVGTNVYAVPASTLVIGAPAIDGARFTGGGVTTMLNDGNATATNPSLTEIATSANVPTLAASGVPCRRPVAVSKLAHAGRLRIEKVSVWRSWSVAVGVNVYSVPTMAVVAGAPVIVGARLFAARPLTVTSNGGSTVCFFPSDT